MSKDKETIKAPLHPAVDNIWYIIVCIESAFDTPYQYWSWKCWMPTWREIIPRNGPLSSPFRLYNLIPFTDRMIFIKCCSDIPKFKSNTRSHNIFEKTKLKYWPFHLIFYILIEIKVLYYTKRPLNDWCWPIWCWQKILSKTKKEW